MRDAKQGTASDKSAPSRDGRGDETSRVGVAAGKCLTASDALHSMASVHASNCQLQLVKRGTPNHLMVSKFFLL